MGIYHREYVFRDGQQHIIPPEQLNHLYAVRHDNRTEYYSVSGSLVDFKRWLINIYTDLSGGKQFKVTGNGRTRYYTMEER